MTNRKTTAQLTEEIAALGETVSTVTTHFNTQIGDLKTIIEGKAGALDDIIGKLNKYMEPVGHAVIVDEPKKPSVPQHEYDRENYDLPQSASFRSSIFGRLVGMLPTVVPWALVVAGLLYWYRFQSTETIDPPTPTPDVPAINKAVGDYFPTQRKEFAAAFADAAAKVRSKEIKTDEQLDALVNPQLKAARDLASKPFDVSFEMGLPRNDDGSFAGKEEDAAKFLELISRSW